MGKPPLSLSYKALLAAVTVLLPVLVTFTHSYNRNKDHLKEGSLKDLMVVAGAYEGQIYQFLEGSKRRVRDFSNDQAIRNNLQELIRGRASSAGTLNDYLFKKLIIDRAIYSISIASSDGRVVASTEGAAIGKDLSDTDSFLKGKEGIAVSEHLAGIFNMPGIAVSAPVLGISSERPIGVITSFFLLSELTRVMSGELQREYGTREKGRETLEVYLVGKDGLMLTESRFAKGAALKQKVDTLPVRQCLDENKETAAFYKDYRGTEVAGTSRCLTETGWILLAEVDADEVLAPAEDMWKNAAMAGMLTVGLIGILFLAFFRGVVRPLRGISAAADSLAAGRYNVAIPVESRDEIGALADSFNKMAVDIKGRTRLLRDSEERLRAIIDNSAAVIYLKDIHGRYSLINAGLEGVAGMAMDRIIGSTDHDIFPKDVADILRANDLKVLESRVPLQFEESLPDSDGMHHYISIKVPILDTAGIPTAVCGISTDITERKALEEQLRQSQKMEAVGRLAGGIAHDFNNILQAMIGYGTLLVTKREEDKLVKGYAEQILSLSSRAASLTQGLLTFSRKRPISLQAVDLNNIVRRTSDILLRLIGERIKLRTDLAYRRLAIKADPVQIEHVLMNLATNAKDSMPDGGTITISTGMTSIDDEFIKVHGYGAHGDYAVVSFADTGTGMDEATQKRVFEPFFTTKEVGKGTGLGLSIVYGIIEQHKGFIGIHSSPGKGTVFRIYLPMAEAAAEEIGPQEPPISRRGGEVVLLSEDEADVRKLMGIVLGDSGYKVIEAVDGDDAIDKFMEHKDDIRLVILDMVMPKKGGREVYEEIRKARPDIKVLLISGYSEDVMKEEGVYCEGLDIVTKPVAPNELLRKIREVIER